MSGFARTAAVCLLFALPIDGFANGFGLRSRTTSYYYPAPARWSPVYPVFPGDPCGACSWQNVPAYQPPIPAASVRPYAVPAPAGPSSAPPLPPRTPEPPLNPKPGVSESRSYFDATTVAAQAAPPLAGERCTVGFWNLTDKDVRLATGSQVFFLPRGKSLRLDMGRQFVWRVDERAPQTEQIPSSESALEIVIRR